jgi:hypothetical protein
MTQLRRTHRILAIDPTTKGFGWVVVEAHPLRLVDWGLRACGNRVTARKRALRQIIDRVAPTSLAMQADLRRPSRTSWIAALANRASGSRRLGVALAPPPTARRSSTDPRNQHERAKLTLATFPELRTSAVRARGAADREAAGMAILDAAWIALAVLQRRAVDPRRRAA